MYIKLFGIVSAQASMDPLYTTVSTPAFIIYKRRLSIIESVFGNPVLLFRKNQHSDTVTHISESMFKPRPMHMRNEYFSNWRKVGVVKEIAVVAKYQTYNSLVID